MSSNLELSKSDGMHALLNRMTGAWKGTTRIWFEPDKLADESPVNATIRSILDGTYLLHEYSGLYQGKPVSGLAIYGYHVDTKRFQSAWVDSFHTGAAIMFSESEKAAPNASMLGSYVYINGEEEQKWGWRTVIDLVNDNELVITSYNVFPTGEEVKGVETIYMRVQEGQ
jgi:hypothetical protein